jgi:hypothetical protein
MKELFKSKVMLGFMVFFVGFLFMNSNDIQKMEEGNKVKNDTYLVMNV